MVVNACSDLISGASTHNESEASVSPTAEINVIIPSPIVVPETCALSPLSNVNLPSTAKEYSPLGANRTSNTDSQNER